MTNETRDVLAAGIGAIEGSEDHAEDRAALVNGYVLAIYEHVRQRLADAELCLVRLRNEANSRRDRTDDEERALVKLLDDVGSPLAYLMGYVDATEKRSR